MALKIHYKEADLASQVLVDEMLDDIGEENLEVRKAARSWALEHLEESIEIGGGLTMGDWQHGMVFWIEGCEQGLKDSKGGQYGRDD